MIIEGQHNQNYGIINKNILRGIYIYIMVKQRVPIIRTANEAATAEIIKGLTKYINRNSNMFSPIYCKRKVISLKEKRKRVLESFPCIGVKISGEILNNFGSLMDFFLSETEEIVKIKGVGQKKARIIREVLY
jgi:Fanconi anemia group M protein